MRYLLGITGASGSIYGVKLAKKLLVSGCFVHLIATDHGKQVMKYETGLEFNEWVESLKQYGDVEVEDINNMFASVASGSYKMDGVIIAPCSMATLGKISCGIGDNLLCRAADVAIKEGRRLVIVPRETPLSPIHLENMLKLSKLGTKIIPAMPAFYNKPESVDDMVNFVVGKVLDSLGIDNNLYKRWGNLD